MYYEPPASYTSYRYFCNDIWEFLSMINWLNGFVTYIGLFWEISHPQMVLLSSIHCCYVPLCLSLYNCPYAVHFVCLWSSNLKADICSWHGVVWSDQCLLTSVSILPAVSPPASSPCPHSWEDWAHQQELHHSTPVQSNTTIIQKYQTQQIHSGTSLTTTTSHIPTNIYIILLYIYNIYILSLIHNLYPTLLSYNVISWCHGRLATLSIMPDLIQPVKVIVLELLWKSFLKVVLGIWSRQWGQNSDHHSFYSISILIWMEKRWIMRRSLGCIPWRAEDMVAVMRISVY